MDYFAYTEIKSTGLVEAPSFKKGVARSINIFRKLNKYTYSRTAQEADSKALYTDWQTVGDDLVEAIKEHDHLRTTNPCERQ